MTHCARQHIHSSFGFTLIELILVVVILGVLAVVAAPNFIDLSRDARVATIESLAGAMQSQERILKAKSNIQGNILNNGTGQPVLDMNGNGVADIESPLNTRGDLSINDGIDIMLIDRNGVLNIDNHQIHKLVSLSDELIPIARDDNQNTDIGLDIDGDGEVRDDNCRVFYSQNSAAFNAVISGC